MAAFRRGCFCLGLRYATNLVRFTRVLVRRQVEKLPTTSTIRKNWTTLSTIGALCAVPFSQKHDGLSHEALIRRASSLVTDSTNTFLSQTTLALVDSVTQYVKAIHSLVTLHKHYVASASKLTPEEEDSVWQVIERQRQEKWNGTPLLSVAGVTSFDKVNLMKLSVLRKDVKRFESNWRMAINLSKLAAEAAYDAGADQASAMAQNSLQVAQSHVDQIQQLSLEAEKNLKVSEAENSQRIMVSEEEDIPDAYLRED